MGKDVIEMFPRIHKTYHDNTTPAAQEVQAPEPEEVNSDAEETVAINYSRSSIMEVAKSIFFSTNTNDNKCEGYTIDFYTTSSNLESLCLHLHTFGKWLNEESNYFGAQRAKESVALLKKIEIYIVLLQKEEKLSFLQIIASKK